MLIGKEIDVAINNVFNYLDTIDLLSDIKLFDGDEVWELMKVLDRKYPYKDQYSETLFDVVTEDEFANYLRNKYNITIKEKTITNLYIYID